MEPGALEGCVVAQKKIRVRRQAAGKKRPQLMCEICTDDGSSRRVKVDSLICWPFHARGKCSDSGTCDKMHLSHEARPVCASHLSFLLGSRKKGCRQKDTSCQLDRAHPDFDTLRKLMISCKNVSKIDKSNNQK